MRLGEQFPKLTRLTRGKQAIASSHNLITSGIIQPKGGSISFGRYSVYCQKSESGQVINKKGFFCTLMYNGKLCVRIIIYLIAIADKLL